MESLFLKHKRVIAWAMGILFASVLCLSALVLVHSADHHDCHADDCRICAAVRSCAALAQTLGTGPAAGAWIVTACFVLVLTLVMESRYIAMVSPVLERVRLNN